VAGPSADDPSLHDELTGTDRLLVSGIVWTAVFRWVAQGLSWVSTLYVARILKPADYGIVAMAAVPIGLARLVEDLGLDAIVVQDRTLDRDQLADIAGAVLCLGGVLTGLFFVLATPIAGYFREPAVAAVVMAMSANFVLDAIQVLPSAFLQREFRFRTLAGLQGLQATIGAIVAAVGATLAWGHWALVVNGLAGSVVTTVVLFALRPFAISWPRRLGRISSSLISGWRMVVSRAAYYAYISSDTVIVGRVLGKDSLGAFGFAKTFASLPVTEVSSVVSKVVPGIFSAVQQSPAKLRRYFLVLTEALSYLTMPMSVGLMLTADSFVRVALGPQWEAVVVPLRILSIYMIMNASQMLFAHVILWTGGYRAYMWLSVLSVTVVPVSILVGVRWGLAGVAWAWVVSYPLTTIPALLIVRRILDMRALPFFATLRPAAVGCLAMAATVLLVRLLLPAAWPDAAKLAAQVATGVVTYPVVLIAAYRPRVRAIYELIRESRRPAVL
jgi:O-antigen/teichoic acid export membrane protein